MLFGFKSDNQNHQHARMSNGWPNLMETTMHNRLRFIALAALGLVSVATQASVSTSDPRQYRIELKQDTGGLDVVVTPFAGEAVVVALENRSDKTARCTAGFADHQHKLLPTEMRHATIAAGKRATLGYSMHKMDEATVVYVTVKCAEKTPAP
jgi:hypothetical protein